MDHVSNHVGWVRFIKNIACHGPCTQFKTRGKFFISKLLFFFIEFFVFRCLVFFSLFFSNNANNQQPTTNNQQQVHSPLAAYEVEEDTLLKLSSINITDEDVDRTPHGTVGVTLSVDHGTLSVSGSEQNQDQTSTLNNDDYLNKLTFATGDGVEDVLIGGGFLGDIATCNPY